MAVQSDTTRIIARALGPFFIIFGVAVAMKTADLSLIVPAFFADGVLVFVIGAFTLLLGLGVFAIHHRWDTIAAIIVSVFAIATALRGAMLLLAPSFVSALSADVVRAGGLILIPAAIAIIAGAYLTFAGWFAKPET